MPLRQKNISVDHEFTQCFIIFQLYFNLIIQKGDTKSEKVEEREKELVALIIHKITWLTGYVLCLIHIYDALLKE